SRNAVLQCFLNRTYADDLDLSRFGPTIQIIFGADNTFETKFCSYPYTLLNLGYPSDFPRQTNFTDKTIVRICQSIMKTGCNTDDDSQINRRLLQLHSACHFNISILIL